MNKFLAMLLIAAFLTACGGGGSDNNDNGESSTAKGTVSGFVTDNDSGAIVKNVTVKASGKETTTGGNGAYEIEDVNTGEITISASKTGYTDYSDKVTVSDGQSTSHDIVLKPKENSVATLRKSCIEILNANESTGNGFYNIDADGNGPLEPFDVYCDMTTEGGGWVMFANHEDGIANITSVEKVTTTEIGVMKSERWKVVRDNMSIGMIFIDENQKVSMLSKDNLASANCNTPDNIDDLTKLSHPSQEGQGQLWHNEVSGCSETGQDYSVVQLLGDTYGNYTCCGASLYQQSTAKFDIWPYQSLAFSANEQNKLLYYLK